MRSVLLTSVRTLLCALDVVLTSVRPCEPAVMRSSAPAVMCSPARAVMYAPKCALLLSLLRSTISYSYEII